MGLSKLNLFTKFDVDAFLNGKTYSIKKITTWEENGVTLGTKLQLIITSDHTNYNDDNVSNYGEVFYAKVRDKKISFNTSTAVILVDIEKATVFKSRNSDYIDSLSVVCRTVVKDETIEL